MTERILRDVVVDRVEHHPDADRLDIAHVGGFPCVVKRGEFAPGDSAVYIPVDMTVPVDRPQFSFLAPRAKDGRARIKALRLRGVFSMGLLLPPCDIDALGVVPYVAPWEMDVHGLDAPPPSPEPPYYDLESLRRHPDVLVPGERVIVTEKLHGSNGRAFRDLDGVLHIGSHGRWKQPDGASEWAMAARGRFGSLPRGVCVYWECVGRVGGFPYGIQKGRVDLFVFDVYGMQTMEWLGVIEPFVVMLGVRQAPVLFDGPYDATLVAALAEGPSTLDPSHIREGIVVRPIHPRTNPRCGRVVLKLHGEGFLTR